jgi:hypothetical protein
MDQPVLPVDSQTPSVVPSVPEVVGEAVSVQAGFGKAVGKRRILVLITLVLFLSVGFFLLNQLRTRGTAPGSQSGLLFEESGEGSLVGVFHQNGTAYFGKLAFEDEKTILLRDVYQPSGFSPDEKGNLIFRVFRRNEGTPAVDQDYQISKDEILFVSKRVSSKVEEAIKNYRPPAPRPSPTLTPVPQPTEAPTLSPLSEVSPTPGGGFRI